MPNDPAPGLLPAIAVAILMTLIAWVFYLIGKAALNGPRNRAIGFRLPALMRTDDAWRAGHTAAVPLLRTGAWTVTALAFLTVAAASDAVVYVVVLAATVGALLTQVVWAALRAHRAARTTRS